MISGPSPQRAGNLLEVHKKTNIDTKESPSKSSKITLKYINNYPDVGPQVTASPVSLQELQNMAKTMDKKDMWIRSDLRLIFSIEDSQIIDETIETLNKIIEH